MDTSSTGDAAAGPFATGSPTATEIGLAELVALLREHRVLLCVTPVLAGLVALAIAFIVAPTFTARTSFLPPKQQQSAAAAALASLGGLAALAGAGGTGSPAEQFVALMQSETVADRLIKQFDLINVYDVRLNVKAREKLKDNTRMSVGRKDGLIRVEVDDHSPVRAAEIANQYVHELRQLLSTLAITEAQQRRAFFGNELQNTRDRLTKAQQALTSSGFNPGALRAEPKAAAESYARLRAEVTGAEVRLHTLRGTLSDNAAEVQQQLAALSALRAQLARLEHAPDAQGSDPNYIGKYREFKYQEAMFDMLARQYELARIDEAREGPLVQVVDSALPPEKKSKPKRAVVALATALATALLLYAWLVVRLAIRKSQGRGRSALPDGTQP